MAVRFDTSEYVNSHGKEPRGRGCWFFEVDGVPHQSTYMPLSEAKKSLKRTFLSRGCMNHRGRKVTVKILP